MSDDPLLDQLTALLQGARREGYERGYADALRRIVDAANTLPGTTPAQGAAATGQVAESTGRRRTRRGSLETRLLEILGEAAEGATIAEIEAAGAADLEPLKGPSIRAALLRLLATGRVTRDGRRWRLATGPAGASPEAAGAAGEPTSPAEEGSTFDQAFMGSSAPDSGQASPGGPEPMTTE